MRRRTRLDFPAPDAPTRNKKSPSGTVRQMFLSASVPFGYVFQTCWKLITGRSLHFGAITNLLLRDATATRCGAPHYPRRRVYPDPVGHVNPRPVADGTDALQLSPAAHVGDRGQE